MTEMYGRCAAAWRSMAHEVFAICMSETKPSCMRAPPEAVKMITGRCSAVARSNRRVTFSPTTLPMDPMKKVDSMMPMAHFKPAMEPWPVRTPSSRPVFPRWASSLSR